MLETQIGLLATRIGNELRDRTSGYEDRTGVAITFDSDDLNSTHAVDQNPAFGAIAASYAGRGLTVRNVSGSAVTVTGSGATISGATSIEPNAALFATPVGTNAWWLQAIAAPAASALYAVDVGNGSSTTIAVTHNLGTQDVFVSGRSTVDGSVEVLSWVPTSDSAIELTFATAPASGEIRVVVANGAGGGPPGPAGAPGATGGQGLPVGGATGTGLVKSSATDYDAAWVDIATQAELDTVAAKVLPAAGTTGQALLKSSATDYAVSWTTIYQVPTGGATGTALVKNSATNYDYSWIDIATQAELDTVDAKSMPAAGTTGQALVKTSATNYATQWSTLLTAPTGGTVGQVLRKNSSTSGDYSWAARDDAYKGLSTKSTGYTTVAADFGTLIVTTATVTMHVALAANVLRRIDIVNSSASTTAIAAAANVTLQGRTNVAAGTGVTAVLVSSTGSVSTYRIIGGIT